MKEGKTAHLKLIERFYTMVSSDFFRKLEDEAKRGNFPFDIIDHIKQKLTQEIDHPLQLLRLKYRTQKRREQEQRQLKERQNQNLKNQEPLVEIAKDEPEVEKQHIEVEGVRGDDEYFNDELKNEKEGVVEEQQVKEEEIDEPKEEEYDFANDLEGIEKEHIIANANEKVEMYLIGQSIKKKYVAKTEKIIIDLEDVFIKYRDREEFFKKINCNFVKIKPEQVKSQMNNGKQ